MSAWAKELAERAKKELAEKRLKDEKDLSDRRMLDAHCGPMLAEVLHATEKIVEELNEEMDEHCISFQGEPDHSKFTLRKGTSETDVHFDRARWVIHSPWNVYHLTVIEGNGVVWQTRGETRRSMINYTSEQVARKEVKKVFQC